MNARLALGVLLTFLLMPALVRAQSNTATVSGRVTDSTGAVLAGAQVSATNLDTRSSTTTRTNGDGVYVIADLHPGEYRMVVAKAGFREIVLTGLVLGVQDAISRNFTMQIGSVIQSFTETAGGKEFNVAPVVSTLVNEEFVQNTPLNGRSFQSLLQLTPGVLVTPSNQSAPGQFSVNGQRTGTNYFMVDGVGANFGTTASVAPVMGGLVPALTIGGGTTACGWTTRLTRD
jgi:hypothetical protein